MEHKLDCGVGFCLDWVRVTVDYEMDNRLMVDQHKAFALEKRAATNSKGYNRVLTMVCGRIDWHTVHKRNRKMITLTGEDLRKARAMGVDERKLILHLGDLPGAHFTRIDIACDLVGGKVKPPERLHKSILDGVASTRAKSFTVFQSHNQSGESTGSTVYVGSRTSETMLRAYDKAAESGEQEQAWTRLELELKNRQADVAAWAICLNGVEKVWREMARKFLFDTGVDWYEACLSDEKAPLLVEEPGRKETNFEKWIREICLPAVAKAVRDEIPGVRETLEYIITRPVE